MLRQNGDVREIGERFSQQGHLLSVILNGKDDLDRFSFASLSQMPDPILLTASGGRPLPYG
jgi:hypothetical protein